MRKILLAILLLGLVSALVISGPVAAQNDETSGDQTQTNQTSTGQTTQSQAGETQTNQPSAGPNECCKLSNDIPSIDKCKAGNIVGPSKTATCDEGEVKVVTSAWAMCCTLDIVYKVTNWIFFIMLLLVVLLIIIGGLLYITAAGDAEKAGKGKQLIIYAIIGLAIGLLAKIIPGIVAFII